MLFLDRFSLLCIQVRVMLISVMGIQFFLVVKYFSAFSTHILPRSGAGCALTLDDLAHFSTSTFKIKQRTLKLVCADNSMTHYFRTACTIIVAVAKLFISICGCYNASTQPQILNSY